jgi:hypothetical protein
MAMSKSAALGLAGQYWSTIQASRSEGRPFVAKNLLAQAETISSSLGEHGWRITGDGTGMPSVERTSEGREASRARARQVDEAKTARQIEREIGAVVDAPARRARRVQISAEQFAAVMTRRSRG